MKQKINETKNGPKIGQTAHMPNVRHAQMGGKWNNPVNMHRKGMNGKLW